jgi:hypothetical protein
MLMAAFAVGVDRYSFYSPQLHTLCVVDILQTTPRGFSRSYTKGNVSIETVVEQDPGQNEVCPKETR